MTEITLSSDKLGMEVSKAAAADESVAAVKVFEDGSIKIKSGTTGTTTITVSNSYGETITVTASVTSDRGLMIDYTKFEKPENAVNAIDYGLSTTATGEDNATALQAAIDALSNGGVVYIPKGIYQITHVQLKEGITLRLEGVLEDYNAAYSDEITTRINNGEFAVLQATDNRMFMNHEDYAYGRTGADNFAITGGVIDMQGKARAFIWCCAENVLLENVIMKDCPNNHAIQVTGSQNVTIRNVMFAGYNLITNTTTAELIQIEETCPACIGYVESTISKYEDFEFISSGNVIIENCYFGKSDEYGAPTFAIGHHGCNGRYSAVGVTIKDCTFDNPLACAIRAYGWKNVEITGCNFLSESSSETITDEHYMIELKVPEGKDRQLASGAYLVMGYERGGIANLNIHDNQFLIGAASAMKGILKSHTTQNYDFGAKAVSNLSIVDSYDGTPYAFTGYKLVNNQISNVRFCDNTVNISNGIGADYIALSNVKGLLVSGNSTAVSTTNITNCTSMDNYLKNFVISAISSNKEVPITLSGADTSIQAYCNASSTTTYYNLTITCSGNGKIERSVDANGNLTIQAVADEGYIFDGFYVGSTKLTGTTYNFSAATTVMAKFIEN